MLSYELLIWKVNVDLPVRLWTRWELYTRCCRTDRIRIGFACYPVLVEAADLSVTRYFCVSVSESIEWTTIDCSCGPSDVHRSKTSLSLASTSASSSLRFGQQSGVTVFMVWRRSKGAIARWRVGADMSRRERTRAGERERM